MANFFYEELEENGQKSAVFTLWKPIMKYAKEDGIAGAKSRDAIVMCLTFQDPIMQQFLSKQNLCTYLVLKFLFFVKLIA